MWNLINLIRFNMITMRIPIIRIFQWLNANSGQKCKYCLPSATRSLLPYCHRININELYSVSVQFILNYVRRNKRKWTCPILAKNDSIHFVVWSISSREKSKDLFKANIFEPVMDFHWILKVPKETFKVCKYCDRSVKREEKHRSTDCNLPSWNFPILITRGITFHCLHHLK